MVENRRLSCAGSTGSVRPWLYRNCVRMGRAKKKRSRRWGPLTSMKGVSATETHPRLWAPSLELEGLFRGNNMTASHRPPGEPQVKYACYFDGDPDLAWGIRQNHEGGW